MKKAFVFLFAVVLIVTGCVSGPSTDEDRVAPDAGEIQQRVEQACFEVVVNDFQ